MKKVLACAVAWFVCIFTTFCIFNFALYCFMGLFHMMYGIKLGTIAYLVAFLSNAVGMLLNEKMGDILNNCENHDD